MKHMLSVALMAAILLTFVPGMLPAQAEIGETYLLEFAYGDEAFDRHMNGQPNEVTFEGHSYSFDEMLNGNEFDHGLKLYGGNTHNVLDFEVPKNMYSIEDNGEPLRLGVFTIDVERKTTMYRFEGNRVSGEFVLTDEMVLTDPYEEEIYLPRNEQGKPVLVDQLYLFSSGYGDNMDYYACSLFIKYEEFAARHKDLSGAERPAITQVPTHSPIPELTAEPTAEPTPEPTAEATVEPTAEPTQEPIAEATVEPTAEPTQEPIAEATVEPTAEPTQEPIAEVTVEPTAEPIPDNTALPAQTEVPVQEPVSAAESVSQAAPTMVPGGRDAEGHVYLPSGGLMLGSTMESVQAVCSARAVVENSQIKDIVSYAGYDYEVVYKFTDGVLTAAEYSTRVFADAGECEDKYNQLNMAMMEAYGMPKSMDDTWGFYAWKPMYQDQMGTAMYKGLVSRVTSFDIPECTVEITIGKGKDDLVKLAAFIRKDTKAVFSMSSFYSDWDFDVTQDEISGNLFITPGNTSSMTFQDRYSRDYKHVMYPDIFCKEVDGTLCPVFRLWLNYVSTESLYIKDMEINMGGTTWIFKGVRVDLPKQVPAKTYQTKEDAVILFGTESLDFLEALLDYQGEVLVRINSSNSTDSRTFAMPQASIDMTKKMYRMFKEAGGVNEVFQEAFGANKVEKKKLTTY